MRQTELARAGEAAQAETVSFLSEGAAYGLAAQRVERMTTHISHIFLVGDHAFKLKRAVALPYLDFSTPALRRAACERELTLNRRTAAELYEAVRPVTREADGALRIAGSGQPVDWLVAMRRFDQAALLDRIADTGALDPSLLRALADTIAAFHASAAHAPGAGGATAMQAIIDGNIESFGATPQGAFDPADIARLSRACAERLRAVRPLLDRRRDAGKVRQCHGDLHLGNICVIDGKPVLFDCIEFSESLAAIDVLYDLAFLLMDLLHRGQAPAANAVFNRYLDRANEADGCAALPLFLAVRAAIRAHIAAMDRPGEARRYLALALELITPPGPRLIGIGGLSGTGKSSLAYRLAPGVDAAPGARVIRSDIVRKRLYGVAPEERLDMSAYNASSSRMVYEAMVSEAATLLAAGHSVILDAVHARQTERETVENLAATMGVPFTGLWLEAAPELLEQRIAARRDDASDADIGVLHRQLSYDLGIMGWRRVDASRDLDRLTAELGGIGPD